jgi:hypothetical protein
MSSTMPLSTAVAPPSSRAAALALALAYVPCSLACALAFQAHVHMSTVRGVQCLQHNACM